MSLDKHFTAPAPSMPPTSSPSPLPPSAAATQAGDANRSATHPAAQPATQPAIQPATRQATRAPWLVQREIGSRWALRLMRWLSLGLGRTGSRPLLWPIAFYYLLFAPTARRASSEYLMRALRLAYPASWWHSLKHFHAFATTVHDRVYLLNDRFDEFNIDVVDAEEVDRALADGQGAFLVGAHMGSFEALRAITRSPATQGRQYRVAMAMVEDNARMINDALAALLPDAKGNEQDAQAQSAAPQIIPLGRPESMLQVQEALSDNTLIGFLADRSLGEQAFYELPFLGQNAAFPLGPFRLAALLRRPLVMMLGLTLGGARYQLRFIRLADFSSVNRGEREAAVKLAMQRYVAELERACVEQPYNWFNFYNFWQTGLPATLAASAASAAPDEQKQMQQSPQLLSASPPNPRGGVHAVDSAPNAKPPPL